MRIGNRRISKRLLFLLVPVVIVFVGGGSAFAAVTFTDIAGNTHEQSILDMAERGITAGYPDGTFRPDQPVTRGQMMTFLDRNNSKNGCTDCHDQTSLIVSKVKQISESLKTTGESYLRATSKDCSGCHGSDQASARIQAHVNPHDASIVGETSPAPINCRTCHQIHQTYTGIDWALQGGGAAVTLETTGGVFDKGDANLCANCHQQRTAIPATVNGMVEVTSSRFGPHHGVEASMLIGKGGFLVTGGESPHYTFTSDACVTCHMGNENAHNFEPDVARCQLSCHPGAEDFDINGVQTEIDTKLETIKAGLIAKGIMNAETELAIPGTYPEELAAAMWNYKFLTEDQCRGIHNPSFAQALADQALAAVE